MNRPQHPLSLIINQDEADASSEGSSTLPEYSSGGFHLSSIGIETIPENNSSYGPITSHCNMSHSETESTMKKKCGHTLRSIISSHPRYSQEAIVRISQIGRGTSSTAHKCIYVPSLSLIALKIIKVSSSSKAKQIEMELKTLHSFKGKDRKPSKSEDDGPQIDDTGSPAVIKSDEETSVANEERELRYCMRQVENHADVLDIAQIESEMNSNNEVKMDSSNTQDTQKFLSAMWNNPPRRVVDDWSSIVSPVSGCQCLVDADRLSQANSVPLEFPTQPPNSTSFPYIVNLLDAYVSTDEMSVCLVLEYMGGGSLTKYLARKTPVKEMDIAIVAYSVLKALEELHDRNIIHRDVKPSNILIDSEGAVKLSDFGISREAVCNDSCEMTFTGSICFMSPERIRGEKYCKSSDLWSLGITILFCITGKSQFPNETGYWNILDSIERKVPSIDSRGTSDCSEELNDFITSCLQRDRKKRPTATQLLQSDFILKAIGKGVISPPLQPKLAGIHKIPVPSGVVESVVNAILDWRPEHMKELTLFGSPNRPESSTAVDLAEGQRRHTEPWKFTAGRPTEISDKPLYSKKAILQLSSALLTNPIEVMRIIVNRLTEIKETERSIRGVKDQFQAKIFNPLYHYFI